MFHLWLGDLVESFGHVMLDTQKDAAIDPGLTRIHGNRYYSRPSALDNVAATQHQKE